MRLLIYILLFAGFGLQAQSKLLQGEVNALLPGTNTEKMNLIGYFDNKYEVQLHLIHNDKDWKGICFYPSSNTKINLEGGMVDNQLILNESIEDNDDTGMWKINIAGDNYKAKWMNSSGSVSFDLTLSPFSNNKTKRAINSMKIDTYTGNIINSDYDIMVYNIDRNTKKANVINLKDARNLSSNVKCKNDDCSDFDIIISGDKKIKRLECHAEKTGVLKVDIYNQFITKFTTKLKKISSVNSNSISYINDKYRFYISYPDLKGEAFGKEMRQKAQNIKNELDAQVAKNYDESNRLELSANSWFDIDFISKDIFSAVLVSQRSYSDKISTKPVLLSLKNGKKINIKDQFKSDFNYSFIVNQFLKDKINKMYKNKSVSNWYHLKPKDFNNVTINKAGIVYSTGFNSIIGTKKIIIPYKDIKENLSRKSILKKLML